MELKNLIGSNDQKLKLREQKLTKEIDAAYEKAVLAATREFKRLEELNPDTPLSSESVKRIMAKTWKAFEEEFNVLVKPVREAMIESYEEGLSETGKILELANEGKSKV